MTPSNKTADQPRSELRFRGGIKDLKVAQPKVTTSSNYSYGSPQTTRTGGAMELTFRIARPEPPKQPSKPYPISYGDQQKPKPWSKPEPKKPAKLKAKKDETEEQLAERQAEADAAYEDRLREWAEGRERREKEIQAWDKAEREWARTEAIYRQQLDAYPARLMAYANLTGLVAALGDVECEVSIAPIATDLPPGFAPSVAFLDSPAADAAALAKAEDDAEQAANEADDALDGYDDEDDD